MDLELAGKVVLITGGTDGLGLGLAKRLAAEGASVAVCGRDQERLRAAETALRQAGADVLVQRADVARAADVAAFVDAAVARWDRIDGVVHNAGRSAAGTIDGLDDAAWDEDLQLKLMGAVRLTRRARCRSCAPAAASCSSRWPWRPRHRGVGANRARSHGLPGWP